MFDVYIDKETLTTVAVVFAIAAISAAAAVRYVQSCVVYQTIDDIRNEVIVRRSKLRQEKRRALLSSKIGQYRNRPPQVYDDDGYF